MEKNDGKKDVEYVLPAGVEKTIAEMVEETLVQKNKATEESKKEQQRLKVERTTEYSTDNLIHPCDELIYKRSTKLNVIEFQKKADEILILSTILKREPSKTSLWRDFSQGDSELSKAMANVSGVGMEWIPSKFSADLIDRVRLARVIANLHGRITMPTNPYSLPVVGSDSIAYRIPETTSEPETAAKAKASQPNTRKVVFTATKLGARVVFSEELNEDSIIPILPFIRENIIVALAAAQENATINGDTSVTHMDSDVTDTLDARKSWNGYRKLTVASAKVDLAGSLSIDKLRAIRKTMGKYGVYASDICFVVSTSGLSQIWGLNAATTTRDIVLTPDKYGPNVPNYIEGEQGRVDGIPIIVSEFVRDNLNATGVYDGITTNKTIILLVNRKVLLYGDRKLITLKTTENIETDQTILVVTQRLDLQALQPTTDPLIALGYNLGA